MGFKKSMTRVFFSNCVYEKQNKTKGSRKPESLTCLRYCLTNFDSVIGVKIYGFQDICLLKTKKTSFYPVKGNKSYNKTSDNFYAWTFADLK